MLSIDYDLLARQLVRAMRGRRSQVQLARRLRYKSNVVYLWESGRHWPTAATYFTALTRTGVEVRAAIASFYRTPPAWLESADVQSPAFAAELVDDLRGDTSIVELAARIDRSRFAVARWLKGKAEPRLPDFLRLVEATSLRLLDFVAQFADPATMSATRDAWRQLQAARSMVSQLPWSPAVLLVMQTEAYLALARHERGWIAERLGLSLEIEDECLEFLSTTGQIERRGERWRVARVQAIDTRADPAAGRRLKAWWAEVGIDRMKADDPGIFSYNVFTVSERDLARLEEMHRSYFRAMRAVIAASEPSERVVAANVQLFPIDRL